LLLDDELPGLTYLKLLCERIPELEVVKAFNNPALFLAELPQLEYDLCILDIEMPGMNGLELAQLLQGTPVIFTTAYKEYAADAFDLDAIDYLLKPIQFERLKQSVNKAVNRLHQTTPNKTFFQLNTDKGKAILYFEQIACILASEVDSRDKKALMTDGSSLTLKNISFSALEAVLPASSFCRVNKQAMVALKTVKFFAFNEITTQLTTSEGQSLKLSLSEVYREDFLKKSQG
jgi:DNA-binding LytR/AlgR family response regulator